MRYPTKWLGLMTMMVLLVPSIQRPGFSEETRAISSRKSLLLLLAQNDNAAARRDEADALFQRGLQQASHSQFSDAIQSWEQALKIYREINESQREAKALNNLGLAHRELAEYQQAIEYFEQALAVYSTVEDRDGEGEVLGNLGIVYGNLGEYQQSIEYLEQALDITRETNNREEEIRILGNLGDAYRNMDEYPKADYLIQQSLDIGDEINFTLYRGQNLNSLGLVKLDLGEYEQAIYYFEKSLSISLQTEDLQLEANVLGNLGIAHEKLAQYQNTIYYLEQQLLIVGRIGNPQGEANVLGNLGVVYSNLGEYRDAREYFEKALDIFQKIGDQQGQAKALANLGLFHGELGQYQQAIDFFEQGLEIFQRIGDRSSESILLVNLGAISNTIDKPLQAINYFLQGLEISREIGDRFSESMLLVNLGISYDALGDYQQAIDTYEQGLIITREIGNRAGEGVALENLGKLLAEQNQPELAIVFLKSSVAVRESIRGGIRELDTDLQQSYTDTVAGTYRFLADLLLEQGRILEAQQVLDLLKLEELREFTDTRATWTGTELAYTDLEAPVAEAHTDLIAFGQKLYECQQTNCAELSDLIDQQEQLIYAYNKQVREFETLVRDNRYDDPLFQDPDNLSGAAQDLLAANPNSVLISPFVTEDKLWLLWAAGSAVGSVQVDVSQGELSSTVQRFGELLTSGGNLPELQAISQQLYGWLIEPLEAELQANGIEQLIFVNDRVTRYIPMAALWDGEQFLIERYTLSTVISPELTDTEDRLTGIDESQVLGLGLSQPVSGFNPLPAVEPELDNIILSGAADTIGIYPGQLHLNEAFTLEQLKDNVLNHRILHIASHAAFVPGRKEDSFILLGDGQKLRVTDIDDMSGRLGNLHLVVLSACQTALGGEAENGDGTEIAGISSYFLKTGRAETVIASLWAVNDTSTSLLMQRFYELLASGELTKAEALRQAQLSLLYDEDTETRLAASRATIEVTAQDGQNSAMTGFQHPYHWAPFILIGNGL